MLRPTKYAWFEAITGEEETIRVTVPYLGRGTYGIVHPLADDDGLAAKLYHEDRTNQGRARRQNRARRLRQMTAMEQPCAGPNARVAWPTTTLRVPDPEDEERATDSSVDGYIMPRAPDDARSLTDLRIRAAGSAEALLAVSRVEEAARELHQQNIVIGDINGQNFALDTEGILWMFDTDGWQFEDPCGRILHADGATDHYTDPELLRSLSGALPNCTRSGCPMWGVSHRPTTSCRPREPRHDDHGIAVLAKELRAG